MWLSMHQKLQLQQRKCRKDERMAFIVCLSYANEYGFMDQICSALPWLGTEIAFEQRGLPYMTSAQNGEGVKNTTKICGQTAHEYCGQRREGSKNQPILRTSYMEAPLSKLHARSGGGRVDKLGG